MKNLKNKLFNLVKRKKTADKTPTRVTNDTVHEHREQVLAGGRRFKYPIQYSKHKLIINSLIIAVAAVILLMALVWQQLYVAQNTSGFMYRITQITNVPVASVAGEPALYSDYLRRLRANIHSAQDLQRIDISNESSKEQISYYKRQSLNKAERIAYARSLAEQYDIKVTSKDVEAVMQRQMKALGVNEQVFSNNLRSSYDWSLGEYHQAVHDRLLIKKVSLAVDDPAKDKIGSIYEQVTDDPDKFGQIAKKESDDKQTSGNNGVVPRIVVGEAEAVDGLAAEARALEKDQISDIIRRIDGYYILKLIDKNENSVKYAQIQVKLTEFEQLFSQIKQDNDITEYIEVKQFEQ